MLVQMKTTNEHTINSELSKIALNITTARTH